MPKGEAPHINEILSKLGLKSAEFLDSGGYKSVYKVVHQSTEIALKIVLLPNDEEEATEVENRLKREVDVLNSITNLGLVKIGTIALCEMEFDNHRYLIYSEEFLTGETIHSLIQKRTRATAEELSNLAITMFAVIEELWRNKIIHRDIKPMNIMATNNIKRPYVLLDPGLAYITNDANFTANSALVPGTLHYLAPEMLRAQFRDSLDYRADLYTVGLTLYEYATLQHPFRIKTDGTVDTISRIMYDAPRKIIDIRSDLPQEMTETIEALLKKKPALRPASIKMLIRKFGG